MPEQEPKILPTSGQSLSAAHWTDEPETVAECDDCLEPVSEDLSDGKRAPRPVPTAGR